jgi:flagellar hook-basal body complex protein FliE
MIRGIEFRLLDSSEVKNGMLSDKKQKSFSEILKEEIERLNHVVKIAELKAIEVASGRNEDILGAVIAMAEAELAVKAAVQIRNKVMQTYQTFIHMQV